MSQNLIKECILKVQVIGVLRMLSGFAETAAFLNLGLTCLNFERTYYDVSLIFWSIFLCLVSRPIQVPQFAIDCFFLLLSS